ncbi:MAG: DUF397 domain-containing protein [Pseudonocardiaceae bacterium]
MTGQNSVTVIDTSWLKSSYSNAAAACVEVRFDGNAVLVRDTKNRAHGPILAVTTTEWVAFLDGLAGRH